MADYEDTKVNDLIINNMSQEKFNELKDAGELDPTQLYCTPEEGGAALPDQSDNAGKFLMTDGVTLSWGSALENGIKNNTGLGITGNGAGSNVIITSAGSIPAPFTMYTDNIYIGTSSTRPSADNTVSIGSGANASNQSSIAIGKGAASRNYPEGIAIGTEASVSGGVAIGYKASAAAPSQYTVAIGYQATCGALGAIQINATHTKNTNSDANTFKVANGNGNFEMMSADGTIPLDRLTGVAKQFSELPSAETYSGKIVQYTGEGTGRGAFYESVMQSGGTNSYSDFYGHVDVSVDNTDTMFSFINAVLEHAGKSPLAVGDSVKIQQLLSDGGVPSELWIEITPTGGVADRTDVDIEWLMTREDFLESGLGFSMSGTEDYMTFTVTGIVGTTYDWKEIKFGETLPDQTGKAGKFLTTDGTTASWGNSLEVSVGSAFPNVHIGSISTGYCRIAIGKGVSGASYGAVSGNVAIGNNSGATSSYTTAIGDNAVAKAGRAIQIGQGTNEDASTFKVGNENGNFEMMSADGTIPRERLKNLVEVLPTADNGYTTVKNFGNGYVEITGYASIGTVGASTGSEVQVDLPAGYTMADTNYWVNIAPTSETTMFDFKAEAKARSTTHFMVAYKNEDTVTGLTAAGVYWEVRGMLATTEA